MQRHLGVVENERDLTREDDSVVDRRGPVNPGLEAKVIEEPRPELVEPDAGAARRRRNRGIALRRFVLHHRDRGRRTLGAPDLVKPHPIRGQLAAHRYGSVGQHDETPSSCVR
jgi:hypothetical protein